MTPKLQLWDNWWSYQAFFKVTRWWRQNWLKQNLKYWREKQNKTKKRFEAQGAVTYKKHIPFKYRKKNYLWSTRRESLLEWYKETANLQNSHACLSKLGQDILVRLNQTVLIFKVCHNLIRYILPIILFCTYPFWDLDVQHEEMHVFLSFVQRQRLGNHRHQHGCASYALKPNTHTQMLACYRCYIYYLPGYLTDTL